MASFITPQAAHALLQWLLALTGVSSAALLAILALRPLLRRLGGSTLAYAVWALLPLALMATALPHPVQMPVDAPLATGGSTPTVEDGMAHISPNAPPLLRDADWLALWLAGSLLMAAYMAGQQRRLQRSLGRLQATNGPGVYQAAHSGAGPLVLGLLRPRIVLPADFAQRYSAQEQALVLAHERAHLRHADLAVNALACVLQALWWFNPLLHWAAACLRFDQELACDHAVLRRHPGQRQTYAQAILKTQLAAQPAASLPPLACHWQPRHPVKERIMQLTRPTPGHAQRRAMHTLLLAAALAAGFGAWAAVADLDTASAVTVATMAQPALAAAAPAAPVAPMAANPASAAPAAVDAAPAAAPSAAEPAKTAAPTKALTTHARPLAAAAAPVQVAAAEPPQAKAPASTELTPTAGAKQAAQGLLPPPAPAEPASAPTAPAHYVVSITHRAETRTADGVLTASHTMRSGPTRLKPGGTMTMAYDPTAHNCNVGVRTTPAPDNMVDLVMNFQCQDAGDAPPRAPRLRTRLGMPATVEFSNNGQAVHKFTLQVDAAES